MSKLLYLIPFQIRDYQFPHKLIISSKIEPIVQTRSHYVRFHGYPVRISAGTIRSLDLSPTLQRA